MTTVDPTLLARTKALDDAFATTFLNVKKWRDDVFEECYKKAAPPPSAGFSAA
jgi:hypothetical protein